MDDLRHANIVLDLFCVILCLLPLVYLVSNQRYKQKLNSYIGILEIPSLDLSLPVMNEWSYPNLKIAPCRYSGSAYTGNFTIAGHNYSTHFGPVRNIDIGAQIIFTDVKGRSFYYEVKAVETLFKDQAAGKSIKENPEF